MALVRRVEGVTVGGREMLRAGGIYFDFEEVLRGSVYLLEGLSAGLRHGLHGGGGVECDGQVGDGRR
jgi:hypothetical protein